MTTKVILITGPAGSGKTTLAERIARNPNWVHVSEDAYWIEIKKGHRPGELRTQEEQRVVQPAVVHDVQSLLATGHQVVLEFILYEDPPLPLIYYHEHLGRPGVDILVRALRPTTAVLARRKSSRGRAGASEHEDRHIQRQLACLDASFVRTEWIVDNSGLSVEQTYDDYFRDFIDDS
jgi:predicted kinase